MTKRERERERELLLKVDLLKAQVDRACRYDPEWGDDRVDRPLGYLVGAERRAQPGYVEDPLMLRCAMAAWDRFSESIAMMSRIRRAGIAEHDGGKRIIVPLYYRDPIARPFGPRYEPSENT